MGNKHMKRHSTPLVLREVQVKAAVRAPHMHEDGQHLQDGELQVLARMWRKWSSRTLLAGMQDGAAALGAPQKLKHKEGFHTQVHSQQKKKKKNYVRTNPHTQILRATLFTVAKKWEHRNVHQLRKRETQLV